MLSMSDFLHSNAGTARNLRELLIFYYELDRGDAERLERAWSLPEQISLHQEEITSNKTALNRAYHRIENMIEKTRQVFVILFYSYAHVSMLPSTLGTPGSP
jgi:hypothetical protein